MQKVNVYLDDVRSLPYTAFEDEEGRKWILVRDINFCKWLLEQGVVHEMSLDHDLGIGHPSGYDLVCWMEETGKWPSGYINVHSANPVGAQKMVVAIGRRPK